MKRIAEVVGRTLTWRELHYHAELATLYDGDKPVLTARLIGDDTRLLIESGDGAWELSTSGSFADRFHLRPANATEEIVVLHNQTLTFSDGRILHAKSNLTGWRFSVQQQDGTELFVVDAAYELLGQARIEADSYGAVHRELPALAALFVGRFALHGLTYVG